MKALIPAMAMALSFGAAAQSPEMFKCKDAAGKITYAGKECKQLGLSSAGEITSRISVAPAPKPGPIAKTRPVEAEPADKKQATVEAPKEPERRCFTVKLPKGGTATRCNDVPEETK